MEGSCRSVGENELVGWGRSSFWLLPNRNRAWDWPWCLDRFLHSYSTCRLSFLPQTFLKHRILHSGFCWPLCTRVVRGCTLMRYFKLHTNLAKLFKDLSVMIDLGYPCELNHCCKTQITAVEEVNASWQKLWWLDQRSTHMTWLFRPNLNKLTPKEAMGDPCDANGGRIDPGFLGWERALTMHGLQTDTSCLTSLNIPGQNRATGKANKLLQNGICGLLPTPAF